MTRLSKRAPTEKAGRACVNLTRTSDGLMDLGRFRMPLRWDVHAGRRSSESRWIMPSLWVSVCASSTLQACSSNNGQSKPKMNREQEDAAVLMGLACRIPPKGVPKLWTCFGNPNQLMCSWCGWSFNRNSGEIKTTNGKSLRACPRCPIEHPALRYAKLPRSSDGDGPVLHHSRRAFAGQSLKYPVRSAATPATQAKQLALPFARDT